MLITVRDEDKPRAVEIGQRLAAAGYRIAATGGTHRALAHAGIESERMNKISDGSPNLLDAILDGQVSMLINTPSVDRVAEVEAARIRRACIETGIPCLTSIDTAWALAQAVEVFRDPHRATCLTLPEYLAGKR